MKPVNLIREKLLGMLIVLLFCLNGSVTILAVTLAPRVNGFSWNPGDPLSYFWNSRDMSNVPGVAAASLVVSIGVYFFVQACLSLHDEEHLSSASDQESERSVL